MTIHPVTLYYWTAQALEAVLMRITTERKACPACGAFLPAGHDEGCPVAAFNLAIETAKRAGQSPARTPARRSSRRGGARQGAGRKSNRGGARPGAGRKPAKAAAKKRTPAKPARPRPSKAKKKARKPHTATFVSTNAGTGSPATPPA